ncbi:MAG: sigma-E factor negative regulatory protein [Pseudomonadota bacterium]
MIQDRGEAISALVDDEVSTREATAAVDSLLDDEELAASWERYHLIRDALHHNLPDHPESELAARIREHLEAEPTPLRSRRRPDWRHVGRQAAGLAVAASVTVAVFLGVWQGPGQQAPENEPALTAEAERGAADSGLSRVASGGGGEAATGAAGERSAASIERYLVNHSEYAGSSSMRGMLPYTRVVGGGEVRTVHEGR